MDKPGTSKSTEGGDDDPSNTPSSSAFTLGQNPIQRLTGMRSPTNLSEWQLQAILFKAKLVQYYDIFISLGGDDIDQIMTSDEREFLEIMSLVGMAEKPLHVRRLQRTLAEFSTDRLRFLNEQIPHIGLPPIPPALAAIPSAETFYTAFQYLNPSAFTPDLSTFNFSPLISAALKQSAASKMATVLPPLTPSTSQLPPLPALSRVTSQPSLASQTSLASQSSLTSQTSVPSQHSLPPQPSLSSQISINRPAPMVKHEPQPSTSRVSAESTVWRDTPILTLEDVTKLRAHVDQVLRFEPNVGPKQSKRQVQKHRRLMEVMQTPESDPNREADFRKYSAIYGSSKRNPEKALTFHEVLINEAAAQICLQRPAMLTIRDRLFTLARSAVRNAGFPGFRFMKPEDRRARGDRSTTPQSGFSNRSGCSTPCPEELARSHTASVEPSEEVEAPSPKRKRSHSP
ncbi:unnamed protein product [Bursaphelenchus okinawaensis]|uniref:NCD1 domain-containing protein n=1 Tax=Bursaphelenchus okinawaensis TaxID=465554 RepID=A0A811K9S0_9BILA|nr:unnamed protein product [Bursaphelenchus okinawaensis]CAG9094916.1 unnamed protein product [Bursaphelenchus okinawaensis]